MFYPKPILIFEDDPDDWYVLRTAAEQADLCRHLERFASREAFFSHLYHRPVNQPPALIILSCNMPANAGQKILEQLRRNPVWANLPVVTFIGAYWPQQGRNRLTQLGTLVDFEKTHDLNKLVNNMRYCKELVMTDLEMLLGTVFID